MKLRYKAPSGGGTVELGDAATVSQLLDALRASTGYTDVIVKYGWPPRALGADQAGATLQSLGLHRESLTVVPDESTSAATAATAAAETRGAENVADAYARQAAPKGVRDQNISVPMPENNSWLVLRVMPDDNSCLFTAVGGALRGLEPQPAGGYTPAALRRMVADHILSRPDKFTAVVLEMPAERYCARMQRPDVWGGAIELGILSELFRVEICAVDVKTNGVVRYGEALGYEQRCVLVYSNIHYDRVAEIFVDGQEEMDFDVTRWPIGTGDGDSGGDGGSAATALGDHVLIRAQELCRKLRDEHHYYTDTSDFVVMCNQCGWVGQGQKALAKHSLETGHTEISEIEDTTT